MFEKVLVANRGEIAVRIIRALREMGVKSVAVYSDADRESFHARLADEAYHIGPALATESYLNIEKLIEVAERSGAEAVHPGYGFLAESAPFARTVREAGLVWIGPRPEAMEAMGSKVESRRIMAKAEVPMTPGTEDTVESAGAVFEFAGEHGYPVAVKASSGGGGKGFAVARDEAGAEEAFARARRRVRRTSGTGRSIWRSTCLLRGTSRYRLCATSTGTRCIWANGIARSSAGTRSSSRSARAQGLTRRCARRWAGRRSRRRRL